MTQSLKDYLEQEYSRTNPAFKGAAKKGWIAAAEGQSLEACPYPDYRGGKHDHIVTFSRAFQKAWKNGWNAFHERT